MIADDKTKNQIVYHVLKQVIRRLQLKFGNTYRLDNVAISGTHTHGSPGGFNEYTLYDAPTLGFVGETHRALISGIVDVS